MQTLNFLKKIFLRVLKNIEVYAPENIDFGTGNTLSNGSILNAQNGKIKLGERTRIGNSSELVAAKNHSIEIKDFTTLYSNCKILGAVVIERYGVLATNIYMSSGNHFAFEHPELLIRKQDQLVRNEQQDINQPIHIHEDVWIGNGVFISQGITIGRGAVVGAGSVVTKNISPYQVVVGNPARPLKNRLDFIPPNQIEAKHQKDLPYFYQGFDHMQSEQSRIENGIRIIDSAIVKLELDSPVLSITGWSEKEFEMTISIGNISQIIKQPLGNFTIIINDFEISNVENILLEITDVQNSNVCIKSLKCSSSI